MRGSHFGPLMPTAVPDATPSRFDGPPRILALGFQMKEGNLHGPRDMFADKGFDRARQIALEMADYMRRMGPFEPHRVGLDELEHTTMPELMKRLQERGRRRPTSRSERPRRPSPRRGPLRGFPPRMRRTIAAR